MLFLGAHITNEQLIEIKKLLDSKIGTRKTAKIMGLSRPTIQQWQKRIKEDPEIYILPSCNEKYFENIQTERQAYWLGFIAADGCISDYNQLCINIGRKDIGLLKEFQADLQSFHSISLQQHLSEYGPTLGKVHEMCMISISSKKLCEDLLKYGIHPRKTFTLEPPNNLPEYLIKHWIRGFIDGDGCFCFKKERPKQVRFSVVGLYNVIEYIHNHLNLTTKISKNRKLYVLHSSNKAELTRIGHYLYDEATVFLKRKREKLDRLLGPTKYGN